MLRLTLVRHAKTEPAHSDQEDWDRLLEPRGQRDAPEMGRRLKHRHMKPERILSSPAVRAIATATIIARELGVQAAKVQQDERLYLAAPKDMLEGRARARRQHASRDDRRSQPRHHGVRRSLSAERSVDNMPTCAVYTLEFDIASVGGARLVERRQRRDMDYPKKT